MVDLNLNPSKLFAFLISDSDFYSFSSYNIIFLSPLNHIQIVISRDFMRNSL